MSKWIEVKVTQIKYFAVEIEDNETEVDAQDIIAAELINDFEEIESSEQPSDQLDNLLNDTDKDRIYSLN